MSVPSILPARVPEDGAELFDNIEMFLRRFVVYPNETALVAHVLWIMHAWFIDKWDSTPRLAFLSTDPGSGKSRALEVTEPLVPRPIHAVNTTSAYLFRKVSDAAGPPTILFDEIDTVFGPKAKENEEVRGMLNAGHRKGAVAGRCVIRGKIIETEELPAYCAVALAGLNDLPDTIMHRSIVVRMKRRTSGEKIEPWRLRTNGPDAAALGERIALWAEDNEHLVGIDWPDMTAMGIEDRKADVWEPLIVMANLAGGSWPERAKCTAVTDVTDKSGATESMGVKLLEDVLNAFTDASAEKLSTEELITALTSMDESPWGDIRGKALDARGLAKFLKPYGVTPKSIRVSDQVFKGYISSDFEDSWSRYLTHVSDTDVHSSRRNKEDETLFANESDDWVVAPDLSVTSVTSVTNLQLATMPGRCPECEYHIETQGHHSECVHSA